MTKPGRIHVGIGGWDYAPWRETFYPEGLAQRLELEYASRQLSAIEINGTYYRTQKPESFAKWCAQTPDDFVFSVKASRYATNRKALGEAGESIQKFIDSGLVELGEKLGPIIWQLAPTKKFDAVELEQFFKLLPAKVGSLPARHVLDARHDSFKHADYLALARRYQVATVFTDSDDYPSFADITGDFIYARLMRTESAIPTGYTKKALAGWSERAGIWAAGGMPGDLPYAVAAPAKKQPARDVFVFFISGAKERAPAAAMELIAAVKKQAKS